MQVLIYEDLQCPDCAIFQAVLDNQLLPRYGSRVHFEHRDFPLTKHAWARHAAIAARFFEEARPELGRAYRKYVLEHQSEINAENFNRELARFADAHAIDPANALAALSSRRLAGLVDQDLEEGLARGISRTPTVLVNGKLFIETFRLEDLASAIDLAFVIQ